MNTVWEDVCTFLDLFPFLIVALAYVIGYRSELLLDKVTQREIMYTYDIAFGSLYQKVTPARSLPMFFALERFKVVGKFCGSISCRYSVEQKTADPETFGQ